MSISRIELYTCNPEDDFNRIGYTLTLPRGRLHGAFTTDPPAECYMLLPRRNLEVPQFARFSYIAPPGYVELNRNHPLASRLVFYLTPALAEGYITAMGASTVEGDTSIVPMGTVARRLGLVGPALNHSLINLPLGSGSRSDAAFSFFIYFSYRRSEVNVNFEIDQFADFFDDRLNIGIGAGSSDVNMPGSFIFNSRGLTSNHDVPIEPVGVSENWFKIGVSFKIIAGHLNIQIFNAGRLTHTINETSALTNDELNPTLSLMPGNLVDVGAFYLWRDRVLSTAEHRRIASNPYALIAPGL